MLLPCLQTGERTGMGHLGGRQPLLAAGCSSSRSWRFLARSGSPGLPCGSQGSLRWPWRSSSHPPPPPPGVSEAHLTTPFAALVGPPRVKEGGWEAERRQCTAAKPGPRRQWLCAKAGSGPLGLDHPFWLGELPTRERAAPPPSPTPASHRPPSRVFRRGHQDRYSWEVSKSR